jgi:hypothetical protein
VRGWLAVSAIILIFTLVFATAAWAYLSSSGFGTATAVVGTLPPPTISAATPGAGTVTISWAAVVPPGSGAVAYYVTRDGGPPGGNCPSASSPSDATGCTDSGLSVGTHRYTVTAVWRSWTATSATTTIQITFGPATHFLLSAATAGPSAGATDNLTITAQDAGNNTVMTYTGSHALTFAGASAVGTHVPTVSNTAGTAVAFGATTAISFTNGVASVSGSSNGVMTLYKAQTATITATDGTINTTTGLPITVGVAAAAPTNLAYVDQSFTTPDQITGTTTANTSVTATETAGDRIGSTYTATATASGSFTISAEAYFGLFVHMTFTYSVVATDAFGNQTSATTITATDTR